MNVFLTGATGYVGAAIAKDLLASGIEVLALVRTAEKARAAHARGMVPVLGSLDALERCTETVAKADAIVHAGYDENSGEDSDRRATRALLAAAARAESRVNAFVYASSAYNQHAWRFAMEDEVVAAASERVATSIVRLGMVYGGLGGTMPDLFAAADAHRVSFYIGEGKAHVSAIHRADAARLFHAIVHHRGRGVFDGVDGRPVTARALAETIAAAVGCDEVRSVTAANAPQEFRDHTKDVLERDVAVLQTRGPVVHWHPRFPSVAEGARHAYDEWKEEIIPPGGR